MTPEQEEALVQQLDALTRVVSSFSAVRPELAVVLDAHMDRTAKALGFEGKICGEPLRYRYQRITQPTEA